MFRILTTVTICFAIASAQSNNGTEGSAVVAAQDNNETNTSYTSYATTTGAPTPGVKLPPGAVAMTPVTESSDTQLYVSTSTATPSSHEPASFTYEPDTTVAYQPSSTVFYYAPEITDYSNTPVYSQPASDTDGTLGPDVVRTETSDSYLAMPTSSSPKEYSYAPEYPAKPVEQSPPPPAFIYAPETPSSTPAQTPPNVYYAPSSKQNLSPAAPSHTAPSFTAAPIPVSHSHSASETANPSAIASHSTTPAPAVTPTPSTPTAPQSTLSVHPHPVSQPATLTTKTTPLYSGTRTAKPETTDAPLTYAHDTPTPKLSSEHLMTYKGYTLSLGPATLAAEPTGLGASGSWTPETMQGAGVRSGGHGRWGAAVAMVVGVGVLCG